MASTAAAALASSASMATRAAPSRFVVVATHGRRSVCVAASPIPSKNDRAHGHQSQRRGIVTLASPPTLTLTAHPAGKLLCDHRARSSSNGPSPGAAASGSARSLSSSSASKRDCYEVLGVPRSADKAAVKKAYFALAKEHHPDRNKDDAGAAERFKEATEAYEILSDEKKRELYDAYGHAGVDPNSGMGGGPGGNPFEGFEGFNFGGGGGGFHFHTSNSGPGEEIDAEELFEAFFGGGGGRRRPRGPRRGADLQMQVRLTFEEAVFGASKDLHLRYQVRDADDPRKIATKERDVTVETPAGIDTGMNLRLAGQGAEGDAGAPKGNLLVQVVVDDDEYFHRDGSDVHTEVPISLTQAVLGGTVDVRTLTGIVEMKIPKGCQVETKLMLRGKGIPRLNGGGSKGNQIVHLQIEIPKKITERQEELLREFDEEARSSGHGISGRIAKAAGSAFEKFFGGKKDEKGTSASNHGDGAKSKQEQSKASSHTEDDDDDEVPKQQAS